MEISHQLAGNEIWQKWQRQEGVCGLGQGGGLEGVCDAVIYKVFGLYPQFLAHSSQNLWNFLSVENNKGVFWAPPKGRVWLSGKPTT